MIPGPDLSTARLDLAEGEPGSSCIDGMKLDDIIRSNLAQSAALFDELAPLAREDQRKPQSAMSLVARLAIQLKTHALALERVLYTALLAAGDEPAVFALRGPHEHHALDVIVDKLLALRPGPELAAALAVARRLFEQQAAVEERELLPVIARALPADERDQLARDLVAEQRRLRPRLLRQVGG